ncbi:YbgC/FadM family acyl-CoA thioesterase [Sulfurovum sp. NBC37-1]|uniref:YbgC/FadM family acyl-CoA thioesterase n=1 Tax=Sulfurovum sp. (strain NBC37-1) TaxID=387093 RepID=UPI0001587CC6|nr:YbgC/FadM family acyl-CoA thioesterase [Sulfurovum sp. NBC37-1]BAF72292.1 thioesterase family protein [Sulfurovum sp. NBC37-1]
MKIRVYYEDTDAGGITYHSRYINFCERARSEIFFERDMVPGEGSDSGFVVRNIKADFLATSTLGDMLYVTSKILSQKSSSMVLLQEIFREETKIFSMEVVLVYIENGRPRRIPEKFQIIFDIF